MPLPANTRQPKAPPPVPFVRCCTAVLLSHVTAGAWQSYEVCITQPAPAERLSCRLSARGVATQRGMGELADPSTDRLTSSPRNRSAPWVACLPLSRIYVRPSRCRCTLAFRAVVRRGNQSHSLQRGPPRRLKRSPHGAVIPEYKSGLTGLEGKIVAAPLQPAEPGLGVDG